MFGPIGTRRMTTLPSKAAALAMPNDEAPVDTAKEGEEMRRGRADGEGADEQSDQEAAILVGPTDGDLHTDRVDAGHSRTGDSAEQQRRDRARIGDDEDGVGGRADNGGDGVEATRIDAVGEAEKGAADAADDEAALHGADEQGEAAGAQIELRSKPGGRGGRRKPQRQHCNLRQGERDQSCWFRHALPTRGRFCRPLRIPDDEVCVQR